MRILRRRSLAALRAEVEPVPQAELARFLPAWQQVGGRLRGPEGVLRVVEQLAGAVLPASALESLVLPARVDAYTPAMLDELTSSGEVLWCGHGELAADDGWVSLHLPETAHLTLPLAEPVAAQDDPPPLDARVLEALSSGGAFFFRALSDALARVGDRPGEQALSDALWELVWQGRITNDTLSPLRARLRGGRTTHRSRPAPARARYGRPARPGSAGSGAAARQRPRAQLAPRRGRPLVGAASRRAGPHRARRARGRAAAGALRRGDARVGGGRGQARRVRRGVPGARRVRGERPRPPRVLRRGPRGEPVRHDRSRRPPARTGRGLRCRGRDGGGRPGQPVRRGAAVARRRGHPPPRPQVRRAGRAPRRRARALRRARRPHGAHLDRRPRGPGRRRPRSGHGGAARAGRPASPSRPSTAHRCSAASTRWWAPSATPASTPPRAACGCAADPGSGPRPCSHPGSARPQSGRARDAARACADPLRIRRGRRDVGSRRRRSPRALHPRR